MSECKIYNHPLVREGRVQADRTLETLSPEYVKIDGRKWEDLLYLIYRLARQVHYFDATFQKDGNWQDFFKKSIPFQLSLIANLDTNQIEQTFREAAQPKFNTLDAVQLIPLFHQQFHLIEQIQQWNQHFSRDQSDFKRLLNGLIHTNFRFALAELIALGNTLQQVLDEEQAENGPDYRFVRADFYTIHRQPAWKFDVSEVTGTAHELLPENFKGSRQAWMDEIIVRLSRTFELLYQGILKLVAAAPDALLKNIGEAVKKESISPENTDLPAGGENGVVATNGNQPDEQNGEEAFQEHSPHLGLLFSFLKLFQLTRDDLNKHTGTHLDFFYKTILQLREKQAQPDFGHLVFNLATTLESHKLEAGTFFLAGEDENGLPIRFKLAEELILNKAKIEHMHTLFLDRAMYLKATSTTLSPADPLLYLIKGLYMAPQAASADGLGAKFENISPPSWPSLGGKETKIKKSAPERGFTLFPRPRLGLLIAAPSLFLQEGARSIFLRLKVRIPDYLQGAANKPILDKFTKAVATQFSFTEATQIAMQEEGLDADRVREIYAEYDEDAKTRTEFDNFFKPGAGQSANFDLPGAGETYLIKKHIRRSQPFRISLSGGDGWFDPFDVYTEWRKAGQEHWLQIEIRLDETQAAVSFFDPEVFGQQVGSRQPMIRLTYNHGSYFDWPLAASALAPLPDDVPSTEQVEQYHVFRDLLIEDVSIDVVAKGVRTLVVQSDEGPLDPGSPFQAFGAAPKSGANFYIGSREVFHKNLKAHTAAEGPALSVNWKWEELPPSLLEHYRMYGKDAGREKYTAQWDILSNGSWLPLQRIGLFSNYSFKSVPKPGAGVTTYVIKVEDVSGRVLLEGTVSGDAGYDINLDLQRVKYYFFLEESYVARTVGTGTNAQYFSDLTIPATGAHSVVTLSGKISAASEDERLAVLKIMIENREARFQTDEFGDFLPSSVQDQNRFNTTSRNGFIRFRLGTQTFLHALYPPAIALQTSAVAASAIDSTKIVKAATYRHSLEPWNAKKGNELNTTAGDANNIENFFAEIPNEPYTPLVGELSINYQAQDEKARIELFQLFPFGDGHYLPVAIGEDAYPTLLPKFQDKDPEGWVEKEGSLFISLKDYQPGQLLTLYFQVAESTADPDAEPPEVVWHYLKDNQWQLLAKDIHILSDGTNGLLNSGIVKLDIPPDISKQNTILPAGYHWLKVSAPERAGAVSESIQVFAQAAKVVFEPAENSHLDRLAKPLPAKSIAEPERNNAAIASVEQPYDSFGGKPAEKEASFYTRVSERLRHKGRAMNLFDYERLVLEAFPKIYSVKCITHTLGRRGRSIDYELAPGFVTVAVIPDLSKIELANRLEPKVTLSTLREIEAYLKTRISPFVRLRVLNPRYEKIHVEGKVAFHSGKSGAYYSRKLEEEIQDFLSPWAEGQVGLISFGGKVFKSSILNFIEQRDYVDYVTELTMRNETGDDVDEIAAASARSILVSGERAIEAVKLVPVP